MLPLQLPELHLVVPPAERRRRRQGRQIRGREALQDRHLHRRDQQRWLLGRGEPVAGLPRPVIQVPRHGRRHGSLASSIQALCCKPPERPPGRDPRKGDSLHGRQVPPPPRAASTDWAPTSPTLTPEMPRCYVVYVGRVQVCTRSGKTARSK